MHVSGRGPTTEIHRSSADNSWGIKTDKNSKVTTVYQRPASRTTWEKITRSIMSSKTGLKATEAHLNNLPGIAELKDTSMRDKNGKLTQKSMNNFMDHINSQIESGALLSLSNPPKKETTIEQKLIKNLVLHENVTFKNINPAVAQNIKTSTDEEIKNKLLVRIKNSDGTLDAKQSITDSINAFFAFPDTDTDLKKSDMPFTIQKHHLKNLAALSINDYLSSEEKVLVNKLSERGEQL